jgi:nicotinamidase-related amidase
MLLMGAEIAEQLLGGVLVEAVLLLALRRSLSAARHLAEELLVVLLHAGDDAALAFEDLIELTAVQPHASALAARVDPDAAAFKLYELATATWARPLSRHESDATHHLHMPLTDSEDCVLIVIDAQPGFYPPELPAEDRDRAARALDRAVWLTIVAGKLDVPVVVTEEEPELNGTTDPRLAPTATRFVKPTFGLAGTPEILEAVRTTERPTAVLVGFETDVCVYQSAVGLLDAGLQVIAVEDATFSPGEMHERGLARLRDAGVRLTHCKALGYEWARAVEHSSALLRPAPFRL